MIVTVILAGGLTEEGNLPTSVKERCRQAILITETDLFLISSRYTLNKPPNLDKSGFIIYENKKMYDYFIANGVSKNKIILESSSTDTVGSAIFTRMYTDALVMDREEGAKINIVTSEFHKSRAAEIFTWAFKLTSTDKRKYVLQFISTKNGDNSIERELHEEKSLMRFQKEWVSITSLNEAFVRLLQQHRNYNGELRSDPMNISVLKTY